MVACAHKPGLYEETEYTCLEGCHLWSLTSSHSVKSVPLVIWMAGLVRTPLRVKSRILVSPQVTKVTSMRILRIETLRCSCQYKTVLLYNYISSMLSFYHRIITNQAKFYTLDLHAGADAVIFVPPPPLRN